MTAPLEKQWHRDKTPNANGGGIPVSVTPKMVSEHVSRTASRMCDRKGGKRHIKTNL